MTFLETIAEKIKELQDSVTHLKTKVLELHELLHSSNVLLDQDFMDNAPVLKATINARAICLQGMNEIKDILRNNDVSFGELKEGEKRKLLNALNARDADDGALNFFVDRLYLLLYQSTSEYHLINTGDFFSIKKKPKEKIIKPKKSKKEQVPKNILLQKYQDLMIQANMFFSNGNLSKAKKKYLAASQLYPNHKYSQKQIKEIETMERVVSEEKIVVNKSKSRNKKTGKRTIIDRDDDDYYNPESDIDIF